MSKKFGEHLRDLRKGETDYSQEDMAKMLNINRSTYTYYEIGKSEPNFTNLRKIATILGVDYNKMFDYEE
ncbi:MAG: helix-turn-helix transcriptional regulator [Ruminococcus sp.]|nr:helix-turn-helix transcriptional regulator [Ruminococcus sp.]